MRYYFSLFVVFAVGALVLAAPMDNQPTSTGVNKEDVKPGLVFWPRLKSVKPRDPDVKYKHLQWHHPVIVVSDVDHAQDKVKVAQISRAPPDSWGSKVEPASNYADLEGDINLGRPKTVRIEHLRYNSNKAVRPGRLQPLIDRINANCPADHQLAPCAEPPGSEHDHSKQSSQPSSSQVSRPGSPKQRSQESSSSQGPQGSQLGGSKQGSLPGSSDDGRQGMTGRGRNKARRSRNK